MSVNVVKYATTSKLDLKSRKKYKNSPAYYQKSLENIKWDLWEIKKKYSNENNAALHIHSNLCQICEYTIWSTGAKGYDFSDEAIWMQDGRDEKTHDFSAHSALTMC